MGSANINFRTNRFCTRNLNLYSPFLSQKYGVVNQFNQELVITFMLFLFINQAFCPGLIQVFVQKYIVSPKITIFQFESAVITADYSRSLFT